MFKKIIGLLMLMALLGLSASAAHAASNLTKNYKVSVTLPPAIGLPAHNSPSIEETTLKPLSRQTSETQIVMRDSKKIILQTIIAQ